MLSLVSDKRCKTATHKDKREKSDKRAAISKNEKRQEKKGKEKDKNPKS